MKNVSISVRLATCAGILTMWSSPHRYMQYENFCELKFGGTKKEAKEGNGAFGHKYCSGNINTFVQKRQNIDVHVLSQLHTWKMGSLGRMCANQWY